MALVFSIHCLGVSVKLLRPASFPNSSNSTGLKSGLLKWRAAGDFLKSLRACPHHPRIHAVRVRRDFQAGGEAFPSDDQGVIPGCIEGIGHAGEEAPYSSPFKLSRVNNAASCGRSRKGLASSQTAFRSNVANRSRTSSLQNEAL